MVRCWRWAVGRWSKGEASGCREAGRQGERQGERGAWSGWSVAGCWLACCAVWVPVLAGAVHALGLQIRGSVQAASLQLLGRGASGTRAVSMTRLRWGFGAGRRWGLGAPAALHCIMLQDAGWATTCARHGLQALQALHAACACEFCIGQVQHRGCAPLVQSAMCSWHCWQYLAVPVQSAMCSWHCWQQWAWHKGPVEHGLAWGLLTGVALVHSRHNGCCTA
jgi:hypothetical protein